MHTDCDKLISTDNTFQMLKKCIVLVSTDNPAPNEISVQLIGTSSVTLAWDSPDNISTFELTYYSLTSTKTSTITNASTIEVEDLCPGTEYTFNLVSVSDNGERSMGVKVTACTSNYLSVCLCSMNLELFYNVALVFD